MNEVEPLNPYTLEDFKTQYEEIKAKNKENEERRKRQKYSSSATNAKMDDFQHYLHCYFDTYYDDIFIRRKGEEPFIRLNDRYLNSLWLEFNELSKSYLSVSIIELLLKSAVVKCDSGLSQFMQQLSEYDGKRDYITDIADTIKTKNQEVLRDRFKRWFVGLVACITTPGVVNDLILVLTGGQGIGKTRFFKRLMPGILANYLVQKLPKLRDKDTEIMLAENVLFVIDEVDTLNFKENTALKELITTQKVKVRKPYDKKQEEYKRLATFGATTNKKQFLTDSTGSRRYLCFEAESIDLNVELPIKMAFSQALFEIKQGFKYWLDQEDIAEQEVLNQEFQFVDPEEELLLAYTRRPLDSDETFDIRWDQTTLLLKNLLELGGMPRTVSNTAVRKLGAALTKHDYPRKTTHGRKTWGVVFVQEDGLSPINYNDLFDSQIVTRRV
ncbi:MAG: VapE domain-containing protein [Cyclobacteriaceae bacterium]